VDCGVGKGASISWVLMIRWLVLAAVTPSQSGYPEADQVVGLQSDQVSLGNFFANAASVGAKTVKGPLPLSVLDT
jgi:hypothetical protein